MDQHLHFHNLGSDTLMLYQRLATLDTGLHPIQGLFKQGIGHPENAGGGLEITRRHERTECRHAFLGLADEILVGNEAISEQQL